jgi:hypothetical protein
MVSVLRYMLRIFIFFCLLGTSALQAQFIQWQHSRIVQDDYRGADHPDAVVDGVGNLHICYWDRLRDRLMYGVADGELECSRGATVGHSAGCCGPPAHSLPGA